MDKSSENQIQGSKQLINNIFIIDYRNGLLWNISELINKDLVYMDIKKSDNGNLVAMDFYAQSYTIDLIQKNRLDSGYIRTIA